MQHRESSRDLVETLKVNLTAIGNETGGQEPRGPSMAVESYLMRTMVEARVACSSQIAKCDCQLWRLALERRRDSFVGPKSLAWRALQEGQENPANFEILSPETWSQMIVKWKRDGNP